MTEIARLALAITTTPQQLNEVVSWTRRAGFYGSLAGLGAYLEHLESLLPALTRVVQLAPGLAPFAKELCWGLTLKPNLDRLPTTPEWDRLRSASRTGSKVDVTTAASGGEPECVAPPHVGVVCSRSLLLHAAAVLMDFAWRGHREQLRSYRHTWGLIQRLRRNEPWSALFPDPADGQATESWVNSPPDPMQLAPDLPLDHLDIDETVSLLVLGIDQRRAAHMMVGAGHRWKAVDPWTKLGKLLKETALSPTGGPQLAGGSAVAADTLASRRTGQAPVTPERMSDRRWGDGASADRDSRELLLDHHHALRGRELQPLRALASRAELMHLREPESQQQLIDAAAGYAASIALATGQTPACALHTRVVHQRALPEAHRDLAEHEGLLVITESADGCQVTRWLPPGQGADFEGFPLVSPPEWPAQALDFRVQELLPLPVNELLPLVEERIGKALDCPAATARFRIKHALAQRLYAANQCQATIRIVCGPGTTGVDPESLHHYIDSRSPGVSNAYAQAQQRLFATGQQSVEPIPVTDEKAFFVVPLDHIQRVLQYMRKQIDDEEVKDPKVLHNRIAVYVATLFVLCTGHREQKQLLHFGWQVYVEALIAFLSDKQVVGAEARFVGLPQGFVDQYTFYLKHIQWLLDKLDRSDPAAARQVRVACGLIDDTESRGQNAAGFLFRFRGDRLVPISTDSVERAVHEAEKSLGIESPTPITARALRRNVATFCSAVGGFGVAIERFLGHGGSRHPLGPGSTVCHLDAINELRPVLDRFYQALQAGAVCPPWLKPDAKTLALPRPAPQLSDEAFEGRSLEAGQDRALAVQAIRSEISLDQLEERGELELDDEAVANIRSRIQARLAYEPGARAKVYCVFHAIPDTVPL